MKREPHRLNLTKQAIERLKAPAIRTYYFDAKCPSLTICITPNDARSWYVYRRMAGKPQRVRLGAWPQMTVEQARKETAKVNAAVAAGKNPARDRTTLGGLWDWWFEQAKVHKKTWTNDRSSWEHLKHWAGRKLSNITRTDVASWHAKLGKDSGPSAANQALAMLRAMYNRATLDMNYEGPNPAAKQQKHRESPRERYLLADELPRLLKAMEGEPLKDLLLLALMTGARRGNLVAMRWSDIDLNSATWTIPAAASKSGKSMTLPLAPEAAKILIDRKATTNGSPWVFPGRGREGHICAPKRDWNRIRKAAGIPDVRLHDLRRTLGSWQAAGGSSLHIIGKSLGHSSSAATAIYARLAIDPIRESVSKATVAILAAANAKEGGNDGKA